MTEMQMDGLMAFYLSLSAVVLKMAPCVPDCRGDRMLLRPRNSALTWGLLREFRQGVLSLFCPTQIPQGGKVATKSFLETLERKWTWSCLRQKLTVVTDSRHRALKRELESEVLWEMKALKSCHRPKPRPGCILRKETRRP